MSDVHLGADLPGAEPRGDLLAQLVRGLASPGPGAPNQGSELVLLGDVFELLDAAPPHLDRRDRSAEAACRRLDWILDGHPVLTAALAEALARGVPVHVVPGNHDLDLHRVEVRTHLRQRLELAAGHRLGALRYHPWIFRVSGVVHAQHGHHHHWPHAADPLRPELRPGRTRERSGSAPAQVVAAHARHLALPPSLVTELAVAVRPRLAPLIARRALRTAGWPPSLGGGYLIEAAQAADEILRRVGLAVPFHVFGHSHAPACVPIGAGDARYLNAGTWLGSGTAATCAAIRVHATSIAGEVRLITPDRAGVGLRRSAT